jgi:hypothetical protein
MKANWTKDILLKTAAVVLMAAALGWAQDKRLLEKSFAPGSIMRVEVGAEACDVKVYQGGGEFIVMIYGDEDAEKYLEFTAEQNGSTLEVGAEKRGGFNSISGVDARIEIVVPTSAIDLSVKTAGGDVSCSDVNGSVNAKTAGGDVSVTNGGGELSAKTAGGDLDVVYSGDVSVVAN